MSLDADSVNEFIYNWLGQKGNGWEYAISLCIGFGSVCAVMYWAIPLCDSHSWWLHLFSPLIIVDSPAVLSHVTHILLCIVVSVCCDVSLVLAVLRNQLNIQHFFPQSRGLMVLEMDDRLYALPSFHWMFLNSETLLNHSTKCAVFFMLWQHDGIFRKNSERWICIE